MENQVITTTTDDSVKLAKKTFGVAFRGYLYQLIGINLIVMALSFVIAGIEIFKLISTTGEFDMTSYMEGYMSTVNANMMVLNAIAYVVVNPLVAFIVCKRNNFKIRDSFKKPVISPILVISLILSVFMIQNCNLLLNQWFTSVTNLNPGPSIEIGDSGYVYIISIIYIVFVGPITEEILCRGAVMNSLSKANSVFALVASSMLFGLMHGNFTQMINAGLMGVVFGYLALKSKSIIPSIIAHIIGNANAFLLEIVYSSDSKIPFIVYTTVVGLALVFSIVTIVTKKLYITEDDKMIEAIKPEISCKESWMLLLKNFWFWAVAVIYIGLSIFTLITQSIAK